MLMSASSGLGGLTGRILTSGPPELPVMRCEALLAVAKAGLAAPADLAGGQFLLEGAVTPLLQERRPRGVGNGKIAKQCV